MKDENLYIGADGRAYAAVPAAERVDPTDPHPKCRYCALDFLRTDCNSVICSKSMRSDGRSVIWIEFIQLRDPNPL